MAELPSSPKDQDLEDLVAAHFVSRGCFVDTRVTDRAPKDVSDIDVLWTDYREVPPKPRPVEVKSGEWGLGDLSWDTLLVWDGSRIARNLEDFGWVLNLLEEHEREGWDVMASQPLAPLASQIGGVISAEERKKIKANTHRGLLGRVERKQAAGAVPFGYRTERIAEGQGCRIVVHPAEAEVVHGIFASFAAGDGIKASRSGSSSLRRSRSSRSPADGAGDGGARRAHRRGRWRAAERDLRKLAT